MSDPLARIEKILQELSALGSKSDELSTKLDKLLTPLLEDRRPPRVILGPDAWATELLDAARHDLRAAEVLAVSTYDHAATIAMLLQMVFEKLAKAWLARTDWDAFIAHRRSHAVASRFTQFLKRNRNFLPNVGPQIQSCAQLGRGAHARAPSPRQEWSAPRVSLGARRSRV